MQAPKPLAWYPHRLAWQFGFSRTQLRRAPALAGLHEFMKRENETGAITRQEAVSMVPPLMLGVQPHHTVRAPWAPFGGGRLAVCVRCCACVWRVRVSTG